MNFAELMCVLQADWKTQVGFLNPIPENAVARDFSRGNRVDQMIDLYFRSIAPLDEGGGSEGLDGWEERTGIPPGKMANDDGSALRESIADLAIVLRLIRESPRDVLLTKQGLRSASEWNLVRKFATKVMEAWGDWKDAPVSDFDDLWRRMGGDDNE
jgi:hypothetical protein